MHRTFPIILLPQPEGGYFVQCPTLPGCYSQGESMDDTMHNIREAIELTISDMQAAGQPVPKHGAAVFTTITVEP